MAKNNFALQKESAKINIGIPEDRREAVAQGLSKLLADSYILYLKTHGYHWNVTGALFQTLHLMFEQEYTELAQAVDQIAERIRALGFYAPASYAQFIKMAQVKEEAGAPSAENMIRDLVSGHEITAKTARSVFSVCEKARDEATLDLLIQRIQTHEKTAWMLRSLLA